ncbi:phage tail [Chlorella sorokiniana]|uniref:Phage tail n=1 Tax=Chlorella sorokiniana TaxID=3076 RepID=A0A2P6TDC4_CHLSO|nr:phage tail [Chlorella sorokiniana]|eukprot:PRW20633.1 phage tail [Chlorella sorokiniana]
MSSREEQQDSACPGRGERAVEDLLAAVGSAVGAVAERIPSTAEHEIRKTLEEQGDISVDTGEPLPRHAGNAREVTGPGDVPAAQVTAPRPGMPAGDLPAQAVPTQGAASSRAS